MRTICKLLILTLLSTLLFQGCATYPPRQPTHYPQPQPSIPTLSQPEPSQPLPKIKPPIQTPDRPATIATDFSIKAEKQIAEGRFDLAAATLERGLRLAPKDATLWSKLAGVKMQQQQYQQARSLAAKSNSLAGGNMAIRQKNQQIIDEALQNTGGK